ncbi:MAG: hypothetical protein HZA24_06080 [Nitrospirae bacterium]|nr:hypothetical protein [Nitrospirota bacterium]
MSTVNLAPVFNALNDLGSPLASGSVYVFQAGTTTMAAVYQDAALTVPHPHPLTLDASGNATIYWPVGVYRIRVTDSAGTLEWEVDDYVVAEINTAAQAGEGILANGSFEGGVAETGAPTAWTLVPDASGAVALDTTAPAHGGTAIKFTTPGGPASGGGIADSDPFPVAEGDDLDAAFMLKASVTTLHVAVDMLWYDAAQVQLVATPSTNLYDNTTTNPAVWTAYSLPVTAPAGARFGRVRLHGGIAGAAAPAGTVWFDAVAVALQVLAADSAKLGGLLPAQFLRSDVPSQVEVVLTFQGEPLLNNARALTGKDTGGVVQEMAVIGPDNKMYLGDINLPTVLRHNGSLTEINGAAIVKSTDVIPVATGGTGATTAAAARANLGVGLTLVAGTALALALPATGSTSVTAQGAHGLGAAPDFYRVRATCLAAEFGYAIGDVVDLSVSLSERDWGGSSGGNTLWTRSMTIAADAVNVYAAYLSGENVLPMLNRTTGAYVSATPANWSVGITPYRFAA